MISTALKMLKPRKSAAAPPNDTKMEHQRQFVTCAFLCVCVCVSVCCQQENGKLTAWGFVSYPISLRRWRECCVSCASSAKSSWLKLIWWIYRKPDEERNPFLVRSLSLSASSIDVARALDAGDTHDLCVFHFGVRNRIATRIAFARVIVPISQCQTVHALDIAHIICWFCSKWASQIDRKRNSRRTFDTNYYRRCRRMARSCSVW